MNTDHTVNQCTNMESSFCEHVTTVKEQDRYHCIDCGMEVDDVVDEPAAFYNYESRCSIRAVQEKSIYTDLAHLDILQSIKDIANNIYIESCIDEVGNFISHRGIVRKAIVFASVFHAFKKISPRSCDSLLSLFKIKRKDALKGLKYINERSPKESFTRVTYITPIHFIKEYMELFHITNVQLQQVYNIYEVVKKRSDIIARSRPQSSASGIIMAYLTITNQTISIKDFVKRINLSELTIQKVSKDVLRILDDIKYTF